jgi:N-acetylated-alpha-linked acidic dipeptidase
MQGGFDFRYRLGGHTPVVHLDVSMVAHDYAIHNVTATIPGSDAPEQSVYMGTHHDSWDGGANDNAGGVAALLTVAESLAPMWKAGHRPRRSIVLCSFDAEEVCYGGSTEFVEARLRDLEEGGVAFLYVDGFTSGTELAGSFSPALVPLYEHLLKDLPDPMIDASLYDAMVQRHGHVHFARPGIVDTLPFYHIAGVPSAYHAFDGPNGVTHSAHDTIEYVHKQDPAHQFSVACMQVWLCCGLRLANAGILPLDYRGYARSYLERLSELAPARMGGSVARQAKALAAVLERYAGGAEAVAETITALSNGRLSLSVEAQARLCELMLRMERDLLTDEGPSDTPWYRHTFVSPACRGTGYKTATFPELTRALRQGGVAKVSAALDQLQGLFARACVTHDTFRAIVA